MNFEELKDLCFEYLSVVASSRAKDIRGVNMRNDKWKDSVIYEAFIPSGFPFEGNFGNWLNITDNILSTKATLQVIEYISDYHNMRGEANGTKFGTDCPMWVKQFMSDHFMILKGHSIDSLVCLFGEALMYKEKSTAYNIIQKIEESFNYLEKIKKFNDALILERSQNPKFDNWIKHRLYNKRSPINFSIPRPLVRETCQIPLSFTEDCVQKNITYEMIFEKFSTDMANRESNIQKVNSVIESSPNGVFAFSAEEYVDNYGYTEEHAIAMYDFHTKVLNLPRRSRRLKRKRNDR